MRMVRACVRLQKKLKTSLPKMALYTIKKNQSLALTRMCLGDSQLEKTEANSLTYLALSTLNLKSRKDRMRGLSFSGIRDLPVSKSEVS